MTQIRKILGDRTSKTPHPITITYTCTSSQGLV
jgi:hypothetical protein